MHHLLLTLSCPTLSLPTPSPAHTLATHPRRPHSDVTLATPSYGPRTRTCARRGAAMKANLVGPRYPCIYKPLTNLEVPLSRSLLLASIHGPPGLKS